MSVEEQLIDLEIRFTHQGKIIATLKLAAVPADVLACARAYVAGINARIDEVLADPSLLPLEYTILNVRPLKWDVGDLVLARNASLGNVVDSRRIVRRSGCPFLTIKSDGGMISRSTNRRWTGVTGS